MKASELEVGQFVSDVNELDQFASVFQVKHVLNGRVLLQLKVKGRDMAYLPRPNGPHEGLYGFSHKCSNGEELPWFVLSAEEILNL